MSVQFEVKGSLARLLATEDIIVEHKNVQTACFNVHTRCLTLPMWERASDDVYTMLVLHEISHALWTPNVDWTIGRKIPPEFVNIVEDVRVEKLCKRKYPGSPKSFYAGYKDLHEQDFFCLENEDLTKMNLADRINLYFKIGSFISLSFSSEERKIADAISNAETFEDALIAAEMLYKYCKANDPQMMDCNLDIPNTDLSGGGYPMELDNSSDSETNESSENQQSNNSNSSTNSDQSQETDPDKSENNQSNSQSPQGSSKSDGEGQGSNSGDQTANGKTGSESSAESEPKVKTVSSLEESIRNLVNPSAQETAYIEVPELDLNKVIVPNLEIHEKCKTFWDKCMEEQYLTSQRMFGDVDSKYREFKQSAQKEVNYLVKEFECRKAADSYARATTSRTGILDCTKLHTYKYNEDLFKKITTLAEGKNHGLIFVLDWSGSMGEVILDTVKQLYNLIWFCRKVMIPFEVYAFTNSYPLVNYDENGKARLRTPAYQKRAGVFHIQESFSMMNLLTSRVKSSVLEQQMKNIFRIVSTFSYHSNYASYSHPPGLSLSGTPLNESLIALHQILPKFRRENKLQKVQCVILTDGEGGQLSYHREYDRKYEDGPYIGTAYLDANSVLRDRKTGTTYKLSTGYAGLTDDLLRNLRDKFANTNFIGIRILESGSSGHFIRRYCDYTHKDYDKLMNSWKKEKSFSIKNSGYHTYFGISGSALSQESEFATPDSATKSQIKNAFIKSLKTKKMNKKILSEFIDLVA